MTQTNTFASKLSVAFVAIAMALSMVAPAQAATAAEMQAQIDALMAQLAAMTTTPAASASACFSFTRSLTIGSQGADVTALQTALIKGGYSVPAGATGYFGSQTAAAVAAWQTANAVSPAAGYFGPVSQAKFAATCGSTSTDEVEDTDTNTDDTSDLKGEASLNDMTIDSASDDTIEEGQEDAEIGVATLEFQDGDAMVTRMDVRLSGIAKVWNIFDEVALMVDGEEVGRMSASDKADYISTSGNAGTLRFTGLDLVANEDEQVEVSIVATVQGAVDTGDQGAYTVALNSLRFIDGTDVTSTENSPDFELGDTAAFTVGNAGTDDELIVKTSSKDPDATTLELKDDAKSGFENVFTFDLDTKDSSNDIELTTVYVTVAVSSSTFDGLVDDYELVIDGTTIDKLADANVIVEESLSILVEKEASTVSLCPSFLNFFVKLVLYSMLFDLVNWSLYLLRIKKLLGS